MEYVLEVLVGYLRCVAVGSAWRARDDYGVGSGVVSGVELELTTWVVFRVALEVGGVVVGSYRSYVII